MVDSPAPLRRLVCVCDGLGDSLLARGFDLIPVDAAGFAAVLDGSRRSAFVRLGGVVIVLRGAVEGLPVSRRDVVLVQPGGPGPRKEDGLGVLSVWRPFAFSPSGCGGCGKGTGAAPAVWFALSVSDTACVLRRWSHRRRGIRRLSCRHWHSSAPDGSASGSSSDGSGMARAMEAGRVTTQAGWMGVATIGTAALQPT